MCLDVSNLKPVAELATVSTSDTFPTHFYIIPGYFLTCDTAGCRVYCLCSKHNVSTKATVRTPVKLYDMAVNVLCHLCAGCTFPSSCGFYASQLKFCNFGLLIRDDKEKSDF